MDNKELEERKKRLREKNTTTKENKMNKAQIKAEIEKLAKELKISFVEACTAMQSAAAKMGNEEILEVITDFKMAKFRVFLESKM